MSTLPSTEQTRDSSLAKFGTGLHTVMTLAVLVFCIWRIPAAKQVFNEYGLTLPLMAQYLIRLSDWLTDHLLMIAVALPLLPIIDFIAIQFCRRWGWFAQALWIAGIGVLLFTVGILTVAGIELPMMKLKEALSH
jgi:hypothetical protein